MNCWEKYSVRAVAVVFHLRTAVPDTAGWKVRFTDRVAMGLEKFTNTAVKSGWPVAWSAGIVPETAGGVVSRVLNPISHVRAAWFPEMSASEVARAHV